MLRPHHVIEWFKARATTGRSDIPQLLDGLLIGGMVVIGGAETNVQKAARMMGVVRVGRLVSISQAQLLPEVTATFDAAAVCQLIMMAKNEAFHETAEQFALTLEQMIADGHTPALALRLFSEQVAKVQKL